MCFNHGAPPHGIPITDDIHKQFPDHVKQAWEIFHDWWKRQESPSRKQMPENVANALKVIEDAPIPDHDGCTGKDSCYVIGVYMHLKD